MGHDRRWKICHNKAVRYSLAYERAFYQIKQPLSTVLPAGVGGTGWDSDQTISVVMSYAIYSI
jgi:hypothetical protein